MMVEGSFVNIAPGSGLGLVLMRTELRRCMDTIDLTLVCPDVLMAPV